jgi:GNAT superfamily N-acetyltransferase
MALAEPGRSADGAGPVLPARGHISMVFVHPAAQGQGTGSALLQALHTDAAGLGRDTLTVWTAAADLPARRLYSARGYRLTGHAKKLSDGRRILQYER